MKKLVIICAAAIALAAPGAAAAQGGVETLFQCTLRNGKTVSVTAQGDNFTYRYGTLRKAERILRATVRSGTAYHKQERRWEIATQIRFTSGEYSYIVHEIPTHRSGDPKGSSGVMVMRGKRVITDHSCRRLTEFRNWGTINRLPEDGDEWARMVLQG